MQKANNLLIKIATLVVLTSFGLITASAQDKQNLGSTKNIKVELTKEESIFLKAHPVILFGTDDRWEPYAIKKADGTIEGFDIDLIKFVNEQAGTNIQIVTGRWAEIVEQAKERKIDGLATSTASKERGLFFNFSNPYIYIFPIFVVAGNSSLKIDRIDDFAGKSVAILKANQFYLNLLGKYPSINVIESPSETEAIKLTIEGKAAAAIVGTTFYNNHIKTFGKDIKVGYIATDHPLNIVYSIRKDWPELVSIVNKALASFPRETKNNLVSLWFGSNLSEFGIGKEEERITLTAQEQDWIKDHPEIRLGVDPAWQPTEFVDKSGHHQGITADYVRILNKRLGLNMIIVPNLSWAQVMEAALQRDVDVLPGVAKTPEREVYLNYTDPIIYIEWVIMSRKETPQINSLSDLEGRLTAVDQGSSTHGRLKNQYPEIPLLLQPTTLDCLRSVNEGRAEATVVELTAATFILQAYNINSLKIDKHVLQKNDPISFAVRNDWPELVQILNNGISSITPDERERIRYKWLAVPIEVGYTIKNVLLIVLSVIAVMGIFIGFFLFWNRRLKKEIRERINAEEEREKLQEEVLKARKLESLGTLAGGIAHDLNNLLFAVMGNISLAQDDLKPETGTSETLKEAEQACIKAKELSARLITFSKGGDPVKKMMSIKSLLKDTIISALSGSNIKPEISISNDIRQANIDESQIKQVVRNIVANAKEAMDDNGQLTVSCENIDIAKKGYLTLNQGQYIKISFADKGCGISKENLEKIFDPYFSTKDMGADKGQGLGLTVSYSIIQKHGGLITVESEPQTGSTFSVYLPALSIKEPDLQKSEEKPIAQEPVKQPATGTGKILLMDDEEAIRTFLSRVLNRLGYDVENCTEGKEAIEIYKKAMESKEPFDVVILDLTSKIGMGGQEAMKRLLEIDPDVKGIIITGYSDDPVVANFRAYGFSGFLTKPTTRDELSKVINEVVSRGQ